MNFKWESSYSGDNGPATNAQFGQAAGIALDSAANLYITDVSNDVIRKISNGIVTTVAGNGTGGFGGDNIPATSAELNRPWAIAVDSSGSLYVADTFNNRIRKIANGLIATVAGDGTLGFSGDGGPATSAQLRDPQGIAIDSTGDIYIADAGNQRIRKVSKGVITTVAGNGTQGFSGDNGPATSAQLAFPDGVALDFDGNLYIDDSNTNQRIRKVSNGIITTVAGNGFEGFSGDNGPATSARMNVAEGIAVDSAGNLYIADTANDRVRKVSNGVITTIAGNGMQGFSGDNGPAINADLGFTVGVAADSVGNVYIAADGFRLLTPTACP